MGPPLSDCLVSSSMIGQLIELALLSLSTRADGPRQSIETAQKIQVAIVGSLRPGLWWTRPTLSQKERKNKTRRLTDQLIPPYPRLAIARGVGTKASARSGASRHNNIQHDPARSTFMPWKLQDQLASTTAVSSCPIPNRHNSLPRCQLSGSPCCAVYIDSSTKKAPRPAVRPLMSSANCNGQKPSITSSIASSIPSGLGTLASLGAILCAPNH